MDRRRPLTAIELERLARALDPAARALGSEPLLGGLDWSTYAVELATPGGRRSVVVRRHDGEGDRPVAAARRLWTALTALGAVDLPVPRPLLFDEGQLLGAASVVMTRCPGAIRPPPADPRWWIDGYAEAVASIQRVDLGTLGSLPRRPDRRSELDQLAEHAGAGQPLPERDDLIRALGAHAEDAEDAALVLRHRDLWFGNTLWTAERVTGIVDWSGACLGGPSGDVAYARLDVHLVLGPGAARAFHDAVERRVGPLTRTAWWELLAAAQGLAWLRDWVDGYREVGLDLTLDLAHDRLSGFIFDARSRLDER